MHPPPEQATGSGHSYERMNQRQHSDCPEDLIPTRSSLLGRLKDWEDKESWRTFFDTYWRLIYGFAIQRGLAHEEAQEVVQETVVAVAKSIAKFQYDPQVCAFKTWLLGVTRSKIANQFARRARHPSMAGKTASPEANTDILERIPDEQGGQWEQAWEEEWQKNLMDTAIQRIRRRVPIEQYQMFDLFVLKQWPARDVARTLGVTIAHVYVTKHRLAKLIRKEVEVLRTKGI
jgi:RNA polymerase sigma-70 factor (ECF subfamily)